MLASNVQPLTELVCVSVLTETALSEKLGLVAERTLIMREPKATSLTHSLEKTLSLLRVPSIMSERSARQRGTCRTGPLSKADKHRPEPRRNVTSLLTTPNVSRL